MAGAYCYYPVSTPAVGDYVFLPVSGYGQTAAIVTGTITALSQAGAMAYQAYLDNLQATKERHMIERKAAADREAAARAAAEQAKIIAQQQAAGATTAPGAEPAMQAGGAGGVPTWAWVGGGLGVGAILLLAVTRRRR